MYVRAPGPVRRAASLPLSLLPHSLRYGRSYRMWRERIVALRADPVARTAYVAQRRGHLLVVAMNAPLYAGRLAPFADAIARGIDDATWARLPILTKDDVRNHGAAMLAVPATSLDLVSTGGTSGNPVAFWLDKGRSVPEFAFINDAWTRSGYRDRDVRAVFRGVLIHNVAETPMEFEPALGELRCSPFHLTDEAMRAYAVEIRRRRIRFIHGYPSAIAIFAAWLAREGETWSQIAGLFPISETLLDHQRALFAQVFPNAQVIPFYGMSEKAAFAVERAGAPGVYDFNPVYGLAELVDADGAPVNTPGQRGRVIGSGFMSLGMPFLRYDTGDEATLVDAPTPANGYKLSVSGLRSRWRQEFLVSKTGGLVSISAINIHSRRYSAVREFQFHQDTAGEATLLAALAEGATEADAQEFLNEIAAKLAGAIDFSLDLREALPTTTRGKRQLIDQKLDLTRFAHADAVGSQPGSGDA